MGEKTCTNKIVCEDGGEPDQPIHLEPRTGS